MKNCKKLMLGLMMSIFSFAYANDWQQHWFNGAIAFRNHDFGKAIEEYTLAINSKENPPQSELYLDRANAYLKSGFFNPEDYKKAIKDLSIIIDSKDVSPSNKSDALWLRAQAYLLAGMRKEFMEDTELSSKTEPYFTQLREDENYASFKLGRLLCCNEKVRKSFIQTLIMQQIVNSENDVIFSSSGVGIVKKVKGAKSLTEFMAQ